MTNPTAAADATGVPDCSRYHGFWVLARNWYPSDTLEWFHVEHLADPFAGPTHAVIALLGGRPFATDLEPQPRAIDGRWCSHGSSERAILAAGGLILFGRRHLGKEIHIIGRVVDNAEVKS